MRQAFSRRALALLSGVLLLAFSWGFAPTSSSAVTIDPYLLYAPTGPLPGANLGQDVESGGDVDADGVQDFMVGMVTGATGAAGNPNAARVYSGRDGAMLWNITRPDPSEPSLNSVAGLGDVNGDGHGDFVVGTPGASKAGIARVFSGKTGGLLGSRTGQYGGDLFGFSVASVQDVDGDKMPELLVGAPGHDEFGTNAGRAYLLSGDTKSQLCIMDGKEPEEGFGYSVAGVGDVNGDGRGDFVVGAPHVGREKTGAGRVYLFAGAVRECHLLHVWEGREAGDAFGYAVAGAGDITADNIPDVIIGAPRLARERVKLPPAPGSAYVFSASAADSYTLLHNWDGHEPDDMFGQSVDGDGACDGDGVPDLIVGASQEHLKDLVGRAYIYSGQSGVELLQFEGRDLYDLFGTNLAWVGDLTGKQPPDELVVGAPGYDAPGAGTAGAANVLSCEKVPRPEIEVTPLTFPLGDTVPGVAIKGDITIANVGDADLVISSAALDTSITSPDYSIVSGGAGVIPPGGSVVVQIGYTPATIGADIGLLRIASNDLDEPEVGVSLSARGAAPDIAVSPTMIDCGGNCTVGAAKSTIVTVKNEGNTALTLNSLSFAGGSSPAFALLSPPALPYVLGDGNSLALTVVYTPVNDGGDAGVLDIGSDDPDEPVVKVDLKGQGKLNQAPIARARYEPPGPRTFQFTSADSVDPDGMIMDYLWEFGDGSTSNDPKPLHTYASDGTYIVLLTIRDDKGDVGRTSVAVEASGSPVRSRFYGVAMQTDGTPLPEDTEIQVYVDGFLRIKTHSMVKTGEGVYGVRVPGSASDAGKPVVFVIGGACKALTPGTWVSQSDTELKLEFESACLASLP